MAESLFEQGQPTDRRVHKVDARRIVLRLAREARFDRGVHQENREKPHRADLPKRYAPIDHRRRHEHEGPTYRRLKKAMQFQ